MAAASSQKTNVREKLQKMFCEVIGDDLRGEIERFVLYDYGAECRKTGRGWDCAVVVTTAGDVHAIASTEITPGAGSQGELKYPHLRSRKLQDICGLGVADISISPYLGVPNILIAAGNGQLFAWGYNKSGQLGVPPESVPASAVPILIRGPLEQESVVRVAVGFKFCACVTAAGEVWTWGCNVLGQLGKGDTVDSSTPCKVQGGLKQTRVVSVCCGVNFIVALTDQGRLWSWGSNERGELGRSSRSMHFDNIPGMVDLPTDAVIKSLACGLCHSLASTSDGRLYAWGYNVSAFVVNDAEDQEPPSFTPWTIDYFQSVATAASFDPCRFGTASAAIKGAHKAFAVTEVAAYPNCFVSAAKMMSGEVYVWGECRIETGIVLFADPALTAYTELDEAFLSFSTRPATFRPVYMQPTFAHGGKRPSISSCLRNAFDDETTADMKFVAEEKAIHAHKAFLKIRSEHFKRMFAKGASWAETEADTIKVTEFSFPVYRAFLFYLYTETLADCLSPDDLIALLDLAQSYCEDELRALCVARIHQNMKCESAPTFYMGAIRCAAKDVEDFSCNFMIRHLTALASSGALRELDAEDLLAPFLEKAAEKKAFCF